MDVLRSIFNPYRAPHLPAYISPVSPADAAALEARRLATLRRLAAEGFVPADGWCDPSVVEAAREDA